MSTARFILIVLLCASPACLLWDSLITLGIVADVLAIALVIIARTLRPGETGFLISIIRPPLAIAAIPAVWIFIQALPLGLFPHPIWKSAEAALAHRLTGAISIDPGATIIALGQYIAMLAVAFVSAAVAIDRQRAESVFIALTIAATAVALMILTHDLFFPGSWLTECAHEQAIDCSAIGAIIASAACMRAIEHREIHPGRRSASGVALMLIASAAALAICIAAVLFAATLPTVVAATSGLVALLCVMLIRRLDLGWLGVTGFAVTAIGSAILLLAAQPSERGTSIALSFAKSDPSLRALSQHVLDDAPLVGTGAGTFMALAPAYRQINDPQPDCSAATTAAVIAIELGRPMLWLIVLSAVAAVVTLLRSSLQRGRDWFYPAMGGGCLLTLLLMSFTNAGLLVTATGLLIAAALGLAFAQSKIRAA